MDAWPYSLLSAFAGYGSWRGGSCSPSCAAAPAAPPCAHPCAALAPAQQVRLSSGPCSADDPSLRVSPFLSRLGQSQECPSAAARIGLDVLCCAAGSTLLRPVPAAAEAVSTRSPSELRASATAAAPAASPSHELGSLAEAGASGSAQQPDAAGEAAPWEAAGGHEGAGASPHGSAASDAGAARGSTAALAGGQERGAVAEASQAGAPDQASAPDQAPAQQVQAGAEVARISTPFAAAAAQEQPPDAPLPAQPAPGGQPPAPVPDSAPSAGSVLPFAPSTTSAISEAQIGMLHVPSVGQGGMAGIAGALRTASTAGSLQHAPAASQQSASPEGSGESPGQGTERGSGAALEQLPGSEEAAPDPSVVNDQRRKPTMSQWNSHCL